MTDLDRFPDWPAAVIALAPRSGVILRDYSHAQRPALAREMAKLCRQYGHRFFVGGEPARTSAGAAFTPPHAAWGSPCRPAYEAGLLPPPMTAPRLTAPHNAGSTAFLYLRFSQPPHMSARAAWRVQFSGAGATRQGARSICLALGGVTEARFKRLAASGALTGYAGISAFNAR